MKTQFDKIYVVSLITNKDRQEFVKYQFNELGLDFEFIYGIDFDHIKHDKNGETIIYPILSDDVKALNNDKMYGCSIDHYRAIIQAYEFGYNNVLILEDDICFIKDKAAIEYYLNNIPEDADFITYAVRFIDGNEHQKFYEYEKQYDDKIHKYIELYNSYLTLCGSMMYGIMNRKTMELYLKNQRNKFRCCDSVNDIYVNPTIKRYSNLYTIAIDQYNKLNYDNKNMNINGCWKINNLSNEYDNYFKPITYNISNINNTLS